MVGKVTVKIADLRSGELIVNYCHHKTKTPTCNSIGETTIFWGVGDQSRCSPEVKAVGSNVQEACDSRGRVVRGCHLPTTREFCRLA